MQEQNQKFEALKSITRDGPFFPYLIKNKGLLESCRFFYNLRTEARELKINSNFAISDVLLKEITGTYPKLERLVLDGCRGEVDISLLPSNLKSLSLKSFKGKVVNIEDLVGLINLEALNVEGFNLEASVAYRNEGLKIDLHELKKLPKLKFLNFKNFTNIVNLQEISNLIELEFLNIGGFTKSINFNLFYNLTNLRNLNLDWATEIIIHDNLPELKNLKVLSLAGYKGNLDFSKLSKLVHLEELRLLYLRERLKNIEHISKLTKSS